MASNFWNGKKVFLTGHTGFKGGWMSMLLFSLGAQVKGFSLDPDGNENLYNIAKIYENEYNDSVKAKDYYQKIILNHEGSIYASEARSRFRFLRGDEITEEK